MLRFWTCFPCRSVSMSWHKKEKWWAVFTRRPIKSARSLTTSRSIITWWRMVKVWRYEAPPLRVAYRNLFLIRLVPLPREVAHPRRMRPPGRQWIINALLTSRRRQPLMTNWNRVVLPLRFPWIVQRPSKLRKNRETAYPYTINSTADLGTSDIAAIQCCTRGIHFLYVHPTESCKIILPDFHLCFARSILSTHLFGATFKD